MKITGTRSYIEVEFEGKVVKIEGELLIGGFVAYKNTMKNWEAPHECEVIDDVLKQKIMDMVVEETKNSHLVITFE